MRFEDISGLLDSQDEVNVALQNIRITVPNNTESSVT
jgi:hypothetical protein